MNQNKQLTPEKVKHVKSEVKTKLLVKKTGNELIGEIKIARSLNAIHKAVLFSARERAISAYLMQCRRFRPREEREDRRHD